MLCMSMSLWVGRYVPAILYKMDMMYVCACAHMCREQIRERRNVCTRAHTLPAVVATRELLEVAPNGTAKALLPLTPNKLQGRTSGKLSLLGKV